MLQEYLPILIFLGIATGVATVMFAVESGLGAAEMEGASATPQDLPEGRGVRHGQ